MRVFSIPKGFQAAGLTALSGVLLGAAISGPVPGETCVSKSSLPPMTYAAPFGQQQQMAADSEQWRVQLTQWEPPQWPPQGFTFDLSNKKTKAVLRFTLHAWIPSPDALRVNQIDELDIFQDTLLILGRAGASSSEAVVVELPSGKILDRFPCFMPTVSPDHRFLAFLKSFPGHPGAVSVSTEYLLYSLARSTAYNRPHFEPGRSYDAGWPAYPPGATNAPGENLVPGLDSPVHWISSERLFWLDAKTLAFADHYPGESRLVVVDLTGEVQSPLVRTQTLDPGRLIDFERCRHKYSAEDWKSTSSDPSGLVRVRAIARTPDKPEAVCLFFDSNPCLTRTELTLQVP